MFRISKMGISLVALLVAGFFFGLEVEAAKTNVSIAGGGKGSGGYRLSGGLSEAVNRSSNKVNISVRPTGGFVANTRIIGSGQAEFAMSSTVFLDFIRRKEGPFQKNPKPVTSIRGIGPVATSYFQLVVPSKSSMKEYKDITGKRVNMGIKGSGAYYISTRTMKWMGLSKKIRQDSMSWGAASRSLIDGKIDVFIIHNPVPSPHVLRISRSMNVRVLNMPEKIRDMFVEHSKGYTKETGIDASVYKGMKGKSFNSISHSVFLVANEKVANDLVYDVVQHTYDPKNSNFLMSGHKGWKVGLKAAKSEGFIKKLLATGTPLHPGAARFWKEKGYKVN